MNIHKLQLGFFIALIALVLVLNFFVFFPYISIVFLAAIIAIIFEPAHKKILASVRNKATIAALLSVVLVLIFIFAPLTFFGILLFQESTDLYAKITSGDSDVVGMINNAIGGIEDVIHRIAPQISLDLQSRLDLEEYVGKAFVWISEHLAVFFSGVVKGLIGFFLMILALFYFFRDGKKLLASLVVLSPLFDTYDDRIIGKLKIAVNSVIRGQITIALIQGILTGIGFAIFGVPNPVIWGTVAAIASLVPTLGTGLVIAPALVYLFLTGTLGQTTGLLVWGVVAVGLVDNFLGPILIERGIKIHPFIILLSVLGGIALFGPIGFIAGPVTLSLLFALLDIYPTIIKTPPPQA